MYFARNLIKCPGQNIKVMFVHLIHHSAGEKFKKNVLNSIKHPDPQRHSFDKLAHYTQKGCKHDFFVHIWTFQ